MSRRLSEMLRWGTCFMLALGFHVAGAAALLARWNDNADAVVNAPVIMIDLTAEPAAPAVAPSELPPGPPRPQVEPQPEPMPAKPVEKADLPPPNLPQQQPPEKIELPPAPEAEVQIPALPPPKPAVPKDKKRRQQDASLASAPSAAERKAARAAAPAPGAASHDPDAMPNWTSQLVAKLQRYKRYPDEARARGEHGVAQLAFSVDRAGGVHHARILRSSGSSALDRETLALLARAAPLPPPPAAVPGAQIPVVVPVRYNFR